MVTTKSTTFLNTSGIVSLHFWTKAWTRLQAIKRYFLLCNQMRGWWSDMKKSVWLEKLRRWWWLMTFLWLLTCLAWRRRSNAFSGLLWLTKWDATSNRQLKCKHNRTRRLRQSTTSVRWRNSIWTSSVRPSTLFSSETRNQSLEFIRWKQQKRCSITKQTNTTWHQSTETTTIRFLQLHRTSRYLKAANTRLQTSLRNRHKTYQRSYSTKGKTQPTGLQAIDKYSTVM